jgi:hypothetical protein
MVAEWGNDLIVQFAKKIDTYPLERRIAYFPTVVAVPARSTFFPSSVSFLPHKDPLPFLSRQGVGKVGACRTFARATRTIPSRR